LDIGFVFLVLQGMQVLQVQQAWERTNPGL